MVHHPRAPPDIPENEYHGCLPLCRCEERSWVRPGQVEVGADAQERYHCGEQQQQEPGEHRC